MSLNSRWTEPEADYENWTIHIGELSFPFNGRTYIYEPGGVYVLAQWRHPAFYKVEHGETVRLRIEASESPALTGVGVEGEPPSEPRYVFAIPKVWDSQDWGIRVFWSDPSFDGALDVVPGRADVTHFKVQWKETGGSWGNPEDVSESTVPASEGAPPPYYRHQYYLNFMGLEEGVEYSVRVIAINDSGEGPPSAEATATPRETDSPKLLGAAVDGATLTLTYNELLDQNTEPPVSSFRVTVGSDIRGINGVSVAGSAVTLILSSAVGPEDEVAVSYFAPWYADYHVTGTEYPFDFHLPRIQDAVGNDAVSFWHRPVTNDTPAASSSQKGESGQNTATGAPAIKGTPLAGQTLTADTSGIKDEDGLAQAVFRYQWLFSEEAGDTEIEGATGSTYTLTAGDQGRPIKVRVTFDDDAGNEETLTSYAVVAVGVAVPDSPPKPDRLHPRHWKTGPVLGGARQQRRLGGHRVQGAVEGGLR